jgi:hypothetical protein
MPESTNIDVAHHLHEAAEQKEETKRRSITFLEIIEAILLAVVAILTAWSGYQAAAWDGRNALYYGEANKGRVTASQISTQGDQYLLFDAITFNAWLQATAEGNSKLQAFYARRFSPEYRMAFDAWLKTDPLHNPKAPTGPGAMPQYRNPLSEQATALANEASASFEKGTAARDTGDKYVRATVLLATVLFLVALSQRFKTTRIRTALLIVGAVLVVVGVFDVSTYPVA